MTERVLPYDRNIVPQETGWWCGPAATQVVLNSRGIIVPEATLAAEIEEVENPGRGDDRDGTDYVGLIEVVLDRRVPQARYTSVYMPNDPPTQAQKDRLWDHIKRSIDNGYGVIMNWVAPPSNKPRGVKGSPNPRYSGGTTYHYVACMGYDDTPGARALWIADSGFWPFNYWISFDQAATLIPPKGYAYADLPPVTPTGPDTVDILARATGLSHARAAQILPTMQDGLRQAECTNSNRIAMFIAQTGHESAGFNATEEYASGSAYEGRRDLGNIYPGDGVRFKGRTWIQITGRHNYGEFSRWAHGKGLVSTPTYFVDHPTELADLKWAGIGAAWYWTDARPDINALSDRRDLETVTRRINGGLNGLVDRRARFDRALAVGDALLHLIGEDDWLNMPSNQEKLDFLYEEFKKLFSSRSPYRTDDKRFETAVGFILNMDRTTHMDMVENAARRGEEWALDLVRRVASGRDDHPGNWLWYPDANGNRQKDHWAIEHARKVLAEIEAQDQ